MFLCVNICIISAFVMSLRILLRTIITSGFYVPTTIWYERCRSGGLRIFRPAGALERALTVAQQTGINIRSCDLRITSRLSWALQHRGGPHIMLDLGKSSCYPSLNVAWTTVTLTGFWTLLRYLRHLVAWGLKPLGGKKKGKKERLPQGNSVADDRTFINKTSLSHTRTVTRTYIRPIRGKVSSTT